MRRRAALIALALALPGAAAADRAIHGSAGAGGALVLTGDRGDRTRLDVVVDLKIGRFGGIAAWRALDGEHDGLVTAGLIYEAAAARPRLVIDLHGEAGADLDARAPLLGGGVRTTIAIVGPLGVALDLGAYLVLDGIDDTRLQLQSSALAVLRW